VENQLDTPRSEETGILGSPRPLKLDSLRRLAQRWDSPQALLSVMVEREVAFPNSNTKPCLILSHHTAPDVDTPFDIGNRVTTSGFVTSTFRAKYNIVVFKLAIVVNTPNCRHLYIHTVTSGHILTITVRHWLSVTSFPLKGMRLHFHYCAGTSCHLRA